MSICKFTLNSYSSMFSVPRCTVSVSPPLMASTVVFRRAIIAVVLVLNHIYSCQAKMIYLECINNVPLSMNTVVQGYNNDDIDFVTATDKFGAVSVPDAYGGVMRIFADCIDFITKDACSPVFIESADKRPVSKVGNLQSLALFNDEQSFLIEEYC